MSSLLGPECILRTWTSRRIMIRAATPTDTPSPEIITQARGAPGSVLYAIGDVHGRADLLAPLVAAVRADAALNACERPPILLFLGDYVDRGPDSRGVIDQIIALQTEGAFRVLPLRGNHDQYLLDFLTTPEHAQSWMDYGGAATLLSYGVRPPLTRTDPDAWVEARDEFVALFPPSHRVFFERTTLAATFGDFVFVHAGVRPGVELADQTPTDLMTIRRTFLKSDPPLPGRVVVFGHTPFAKPSLSKGRISVDTGAYATNVLSAVKIVDNRVSFLQVGAA